MKKIYLLLLFFFIGSYAFANDIIIVKEPQPIRACEGESASISVSSYSKSDSKLMFQWYKDDIALSNEIAPILQFKSLEHSKAGAYYCKISNSIGESINTNVAALYILRETVITAQPQNVIVGEIDKNSFAHLTFDAHVGGLSIDESIQIGEFVKIQWYRVEDGLDVKLVNNEQYYGVNSNKLSIKLFGLPNLTYYYAIIEGRCGIAKTNTITVRKNIELLNISLNGLESCEGDYKELIANVDNPENYDLEYKWYKDGKEINFLTNVKGVKTTILSFEPILSLHTGKYKLEAKIKGLDYSVFSNEVDVSVGVKPNIVCVRVDTLYGNLLPDRGEPTYDQMFMLSWLNIFFEYNSASMQFDVYKDGVLVETLYSDSSLFSLGNIYYLRYSYDKKDSSKFWVIAQNHCGVAYSDTISLYEQTICDPFNQYREPLCEYDSLSIYLNYKANKPKEQSHIRWDFGLGSVHGIVPTINNMITTLEDRIELKRLGDIATFLVTYSYSDNDTTVMAKTDTRYIAYSAVNNNIDWTNYNEFCCYYIKMGISPVILRQPTNKIVTYGAKDTIFYTYLDNEYGKKVNVELYYMATLNYEPILIDKSEPDLGRWYSYIRNVNSGDAGYYYAVIRYNNFCKPVITDTIQVIVPQQGITNISDDISQANYSIQPNPASDFIIIYSKISDESSHFYHSTARIFNIYGVEVVKSELSDGNNRIDISNLPRGTYFIKVGDKVEKFVKM